MSPADNFADGVRLSSALTELELLQHDDNAAAKMVSRYM